MNLQSVQSGFSQFSHRHREIKHNDSSDSSDSSVSLRFSQFSLWVVDHDFNTWFDSEPLARSTQILPRAGVDGASQSSSSKSLGSLRAPPGKVAAGLSSLKHSMATAAGRPEQEQGAAAWRVAREAEARARRLPAVAGWGATRAARAASVRAAVGGEVILMRPPVHFIRSSPYSTKTKQKTGVRANDLAAHDG